MNSERTCTRKIISKMVCRNVLHVEGGGVAYIQYLTFDGTALPLPNSYEVSMTDVEAESNGQTEARTVQQQYCICSKRLNPIDIVGYG